MMRFINFPSPALIITLLWPFNFALGTDYPTYKDGLLTIPAVNTDEQVGKYQDITFKLTEQGTWQLLSVRTIYAPNSGLAIDKVDVVKNDSFPVQVFLRLSGSTSCWSVGQINQRLQNNLFEIAVATQFIPSATCIPFVKSFVRTIALPVYGLSAGTYSYNVNGTTGTFKLTADNKYPGDY